MFKVTVIVDDNKLPKVMWALDSLVLGSPEIVPLKREESLPVPTESKRKPGTCIGKVIEAVKALGAGSRLTTADIHKLWTNAGGSANSIPHATADRLVAKSILRKVDRGVWEVNDPNFFYTPNPRTRNFNVTTKLINELTSIGYGTLLNNKDLEGLYTNAGGSNAVKGSNISQRLKQKSLIESTNTPGVWRVIVPNHPLPVPALSNSHETKDMS